MQSAEWMQRKNVEYKQKIEELNELCTQLKEQLATKELNEYEQEVRIRDLRTQLKEVSDMEEKLSLANRNARVLEEENNSLLLKLKSGEMASSNTSAIHVEAIKLIEENNELRNEMEELRASISKSIQREHQLDQRCKMLVEQQEKTDAQMLLLKKRNGELEERLREEQHQWSLGKDAWENERSRYIQDYEELLSSVQRLDGPAQQRDLRDIKDRDNEHQLQQTLLKEDIVELEEKVRLAEERFRTKEREWWQLESTLRAEINSLKKSSNQGGKEVYRAFQDQLASFKQEVTAFRGERRASRIPPTFPIETTLTEDSEDQISDLEAEMQSNSNRMKTYEEINLSLNKKIAVITKENEELREEIERLQDKCSRIENREREREVRIKELEVLVAASAQKNKSIMSNTSKYGNERNSNKYSDTEKEDVFQENEQLRSSLRRSEKQIEALKATHAQELAIHEARQNEQMTKIEDLLRQSNSLRTRAPTLNSRKSSVPDRFQELQELIFRESDQNRKRRVGMDPSVVDKFSKDKIDSVEDVMHALEAAWANEEEAKRELKKLSRENAELASELGNADHRAKEEELRRCIQHLDDLEAQRQKDILRYQTGKDQLIDRVNDLQYDNKMKDDKIQDLQNRLRLLENQLKNDEQELRKTPVFSKEDEMENRMKRLEAAIAQKEADMNGISKYKDKRIQELNDQLATMREANDGLWKQLVNIQDKKLGSQGRPSSGRTSRTPRGSARRHSIEPLIYSQPSTQLSEERRRTVVADGAHLAVTIVELSDIMRNGKIITEPGYVIVKVKSVKEKYKTSVKELASVIRFDETFVFYLAQPDEDVITLHVYYKPKSSSREYHVGDACFTMASLYRGVPRQRLAIVAQNPGTKDARRSAQVEVIMQSDDFGKMTVPTEAEVEDEKLRFSELLKRMEVSSPENLHHVDVLMATNAIP